MFRFDRPLRIVYVLSLKGFKMKKTLIALAVLGATAGVAHAQSNVTIYGIVDTGFVKETGSKAYMNEKVNNRIGFRGVEDLGGGLKATFELEERFNLFDGSSRGDSKSSGSLTKSEDFDGAANVGLAGNWGAVRFGRVNELSTETLRTLDPFNQYGVGGMFESPLRSARISSTARFDSANYAGFKFGASYSLENQSGGAQDDQAYGNAGWAVSGKYANGPVAVLANYNKAQNSDDSSNWNVGGSYAFGPAKIAVAYEKTKVTAGGAVVGFDDPVDGDAVEGSYKNVLVGVSYKIGAGTINASYNHLKTPQDYKDQKFALGYTHDLSKRTSVYLDYAHLKADSDRNLSDDTVNSVQVGMTHKF